MAARKFELPRIYPITDRIISGLSHSDQIDALVDGGARFIQIRDKSATSGEFFYSAELCLRVAKKNNAKLIVNDRVDIAMILGADGVHLGQDDLPPSEARKLLGDKTIIGFSTHTVDQARAAIGLPIDYIAFGPIFPTVTKTDHDPVVGLENLKRLRDAVKDIPLVAIGGINLENMSSILGAGADSVAMISALVGEPTKIAENMRAAIKRSGCVS